MNPYKILFVCWGNICRSPAAENVFNKLLKEQNLETEISCDSAGTIADHNGQAPDRRMSQAGARRGIHFKGQSRKIRPEDWDAFDLILAMDHFNLSELQSMKPGEGVRAELRLFGTFINSESPPEVPDPYYGGSRGFEDVLDLVEDGCRNLIRYIRNR